MEDDGHAASSMIGIKLESGLLDAAPIDADRSVSAPTSNARNGISTSPPASLDGLKSRSDGADQIRIPAEAKPPPPSRKPSHPKTSTRDPPLYSDLPEVTADSCKTFQLIPDCLYGSKHLGSTDNDAFDCDCREEWSMFFSQLRSYLQTSSLPCASILWEPAFLWASSFSSA